VDSDQQARQATAEALARRFEPDYRVISADPATAGLTERQRLVTDGEDVALIAADHRLPGISGLVFLQRASELHRNASRVLLLEMDQYHVLPGYRRRGQTLEEARCCWAATSATDPSNGWRGQWAKARSQSAPSTAILPK
jgi:hypothetical protein